MVIVNYLRQQLPERADLVCEADVAYLLCTRLHFFALERSFASVKRYFDRFQVLRTHLELLRSSKIF